MAIHWFPGHMHKARKEMLEVLPQIDLIIEVVDARIPYSSENPFAAELRGDRPLIKILNKSDLADPRVVKDWQAYLEEEQGITALALTTKEPAEINKIPDICRQLLPNKDQQGKEIRTLIMGIPNVGKSSIINILAGRTIAKVGNEPAVTKRQQRINLRNGIVLSDTPGILWPKVHNENSSYRLAVTGAIKDTAMDYDDVAFFAAEYLLEAYPEELKARYKLDELPQSEMELIEAIGQARGFKRAGGRIDIHKASEILLHEFRAGTLGKLCLETPAMARVEKIAVAERLAIEAEEKEAKKKQRKKRRR